MSDQPGTETIEDHTDAIAILDDWLGEPEPVDEVDSTPETQATTGPIAED